MSLRCADLPKCNSYSFLVQIRELYIIFRGTKDNQDLPIVLDCKLGPFYADASVLIRCVATPASASSPSHSTEDISVQSTEIRECIERYGIDMPMQDTLSLTESVSQRTGKCTETTSTEINQIVLKVEDTVVIRESKYTQAEENDNGTNPM